ncbi:MULTISPECIES: hypothetical protein [unclassified Pseudomonas]|uniref:hypothetical protein n=1 Tax=unclassified Pseudomonas TaxID=196821 RepID=UPI001F3C27F0|nr:MULTISPECIES: hypothetical protein [unclassified Pseudomonas]MCF5228571.1 hypothetical protein [Pseudomonas sp. PA-5-4H]MCF5236222.1 hypothetical protein [Pseudomonas sp. PA-5-4G]MCF5247430.1 hypothetical protein [Pseudomonas sp. PA-5-4B]MCF5253580.1 hypothetical protein [Pseudomonas sp. PA-5-4B]MCF5262774.1 hypothetical protein [Pseudomonas sp. PA-5-4A]
MKSVAEDLPKVEAPSLQARIEAALMTLACQGDPGLRTKLSLMYPSQDIDKQSCLKFATIVLSRTIAASLQALPLLATEKTSKELAEYLASEFRCP